VCPSVTPSSINKGKKLKNKEEKENYKKGERTEKKTKKEKN